MLQPKVTKYAKQQRGKTIGMTNKGACVSFGEFGIKSLDSGRITSRQIESARKTISRYIKRFGKVWIRIFPDKPITKKPIEVRQGKGKGNVEYWVFPIKAGHVIFELDGVSFEIAKEAFRLASHKLPVRVVFVKRSLI